MKGFLGWYRNHRSEPYFTFLKDGRKTIEGRLNKGRYAKVKVGDKIRVYNMDETEYVKVKIVRVAKYSSFKELLMKEAYKKVLPDVKSIDEGLDVYRRFYTEDQENDFGTVAIEVELIN